MWLTQMIRTPPPNNSPEIGPILYQVNDLLSGSWRFYRRTYARFSRMFTGPRWRSFLPPVTGSPTWTSHVHRSALNAHRINKFSYLCPFTILFRIGNQITLLCFENFILFTKSVKMVLSAKDQLLLLSLLNVTTNFIIVGKVTCADEI